MVNTTLVVFMIITITLLFVSMILSSMAAVDAYKKNSDNARNYAMGSSLVTGISVAIIAIILVIYIYSSRHQIAKGAVGYLGQAHQAAQGFAGGAQGLGSQM